MKLQTKTVGNYIVFQEYFTRLVSVLHLQTKFFTFTLKIADDILKARRKLKEAEVTSNLESEQENNDKSGRQKRKPKIVRKLYDTSDDEYNSGDEVLPRPPPIKRISLGSNLISPDGNGT